MSEVSRCLQCSCSLDPAEQEIQVQTQEVDLFGLYVTLNNGSSTSIAVLVVLWAMPSVLAVCDHLVSGVCSEMEEELEFQEFKRSYLKGMVDDEEEDGNVSGGDDMAPKEK